MPATEVMTDREILKKDFKGMLSHRYISREKLQEAICAQVFPESVNAMMPEGVIEAARRVKNLSHEEHQKRIEDLINAYEKRSEERGLRSSRGD